MKAQFRRFAAEEFAETAESCFLASDECLFDIEALDTRRNQIGPPVEKRDNARLQIYFPPQRGARYVMGVDPAGGGADGDYACAEVIELTTGMQCAELHGHYSPQELAARIAVLAREYNNALIAVERNNHGHAVLAHLEASQHYEYVFEQSGQRGWLTTSASRPRMISNFAATLVACPSLFHSARLLEECRTFVRREDGSAAAASGTHDDCVMAMAIALAVRGETADERPREAVMELASLPSLT